MRVEAPRLSEQPVLPSFPTVTSLPSKGKERPPHLSGDAEGKGPPMKKRKRFSCSHWRAGWNCLSWTARFRAAPHCPAWHPACGKRWTKHPPQRMRPLSRCTSGKTHPGSRTSAKRRLPSRPRAKWRNTSSRRSLQPRSPSPSPLSIYRALSTSRPPPNWKRPPLKPGKGSNSRSNSCKRSGGSLKSNYTAPGPRATATRRSVSVLCWNRTERRWKSSSNVRPTYWA